MEPNELNRIRRDEAEPDVRRMLASSLLLKAENLPTNRVAVARDLGWPLRRLDTALAAAEERGWVKLNRIA